jgi:hypothetical protein
MGVPVRDNLDETIEETFPASDAPANTPETGIRIEPAADAELPDATKQDENGPEPPPPMLWPS